MVRVSERQLREAIEEQVGTDWWCHYGETLRVEDADWADQPPLLGLVDLAELALIDALLSGLDEQVEEVA